MQQPEKNTFLASDGLRQRNDQTSTLEGGEKPGGCQQASEVEEEERTMLRPQPNYVDPAGRSENDCQPTSRQTRR